MERVGSEVSMSDEKTVSDRLVDALLVKDKQVEECRALLRNERFMSERLRRLIGALRQKNKALRKKLKST